MSNHSPQAKIDQVTDKDQSDLSQLSKPSVDQSLLTSRKKIADIDQHQVLDSIEALADQVRHAWQQANQVKLELEQPVKNVVVAGMGGSGLGPDLIKHLFKDQLTVPLEVYNSYTLPHYVDERSLVVLSSYSGNTEEILSCAQQAVERTSNLAAITTGGKLGDLCQQKQIPTYFIKPKYNPSGQPRMALGYALAGMMGLLNQAQIIRVGDSQVKAVVSTILTSLESNGVEQAAEINPAKTLAFMSVDRRPMIIAAEFLAGAAHVAANQFNENAKTLADYKLIPEINHHLLEGLKLPSSNQLDNLFLFIHSQLYHQRNQKRLTLSQQAVENKGIQTLAINLKAPSKLEQNFELITVMTLASFYLAILHKIDPSQIPTVDQFKQELGSYQPTA